MAPQIRDNIFVYRARRVDKNFKPGTQTRPSDLGHPPAAGSRRGRLNREGSPLFYASTSKAPLLFELAAQPLEEFVFSIWRLSVRPMLSCLGYEQSVFMSLGAEREPPYSAKALKFDRDPTYEDVLSELFMERVETADAEKYKLTIAIAELHYGLLEGGASRFAGVLYPSVAMSANGDNIALLPWFVEQSVVWMKAIHLKVLGSDGSSFSIETIKKSHELSVSGTLLWTEGSGTVIGETGYVECTFKAGVNEHGDYELGKDGIGHWLCENKTSGRVFCV